MVEDSNLSLKILEAQENERKRIARELHDDSVQELTSIVHKIELCSKLIQMDPIRCKLELMTMSNTVRGIIEDMRQMIYDLRPMSFDDIGFDVTVDRALDRMRSETETKIVFSCEEGVNDTEQVILITLLRIIMEACTNSIKYAQAKNINVNIQKIKGEIYLEIIDNGKGFDVKKTMERKQDNNTGFGLKIMKERVALLSGTIDIDSLIGKGTKISVNVPTCKEEEI